MAQVTRSTIAPLHDKISVTLSKEDYLPGFEKSLKQQAKNVNVPGFRKGHVPAAMLKKMYGPAIYQDEVLRTAGQELENYLRAENLAIFGQPMALPSQTQQSIDMANPGDFTFDFEVGLKPEFDVPSLTNGTVLTRYKVDVTDEMVNDELKRMSQRFGKMEHPDVSETEDDVVFFETGVADQQGSTERPVMISRLPEALRAKFIGAKAGDELTINPATDFADAGEASTFAKEILNTDQLEGEHTAKVSKIGRIDLAPVDEALFAQVYPKDTPADEAAFRTNVREDLQREYDRIAGERMDSEIFENLVHTTPIELPKDFLKRWMQNGGAEDKPKTAEQVEAEFPQFEHQLKWSLISDKLIGDNGVQVGIEDIRKDIKGKVMSYFGVEDLDDAPWMDNYMKTVEKDEKMMNETYQNLLFGQLFEKLRGKFATEEKAIGEKEFFALPRPGAAQHQH
ncbi:MAG: trigger factor [Sphingobacteriales bacterium]|nr:MAG: trigger factor [Sphingobacteriales bacterium]